MSPPSVFDRFGRISTFPFMRQHSSGDRNINTFSATAVGPSGSSEPQSVRPQAPTAETAELLRCFREECGCVFSDYPSWREHNKTCHVQSLRYQCVFTKCAERFSSDSPDSFIRHEKMHRMWVCKKIECFSQFDRRDRALKHATKDHKFESPGDWVKEAWSTTSLKRKKGAHGEDLELANLLEELEAKTLRKTNGAPVPERAHLPTSSFEGVRTRPDGHIVHATLPSAIFACVTDQLSILNSLLDHHSLIPTVPESRKLQQALDMLQEKLRIGENRQTVPDGWNGSFDFNSFALSPEHTGIGSPATNGHVAPSGRRRANKLSPSLPGDSSPSNSHDIDHQLSDIGSLFEGDSDEDLEETQEPLEIDREPRQATNLEKSEQIRYFEAMQKCCVEAAFTFYQRHKPHLDTINDKSLKPLCQTAKKGPIEGPADLSLPHWTHLLRRISDARGLKKEMVSRIESFNGDISPVDELQHAFKKEKVKSDRDLLALIQLARNFCWQLKDWDRCRSLDDLYSLVDGEIRRVRRNDSQTSRKQRPRLRHGEETSEGSGFRVRSPHRQSATWPRAILDTEAEEHRLL